MTTLVDGVAASDVVPAAVEAQLESSVPQFVRDLSVLVAGGLLGWIGNLLTLSYVGRTLGTESFGLLTFGLTVTAYVTMFIAPGLTVWGVRMAAKHRRHAGRYLVLVNATQTTLAVIVFALVALISRLTLSRSEFLVVTASALALFGTSTSVQWMCQALGRLSLVGLGQAMASMLTLGAVLALVRSPADVYRVPVLTVAAQVLTTAAILALLMRDRPFADWRLRSSWVAGSLRAGMPLGMSQILIVVLHNANTLFVKYFRGAAELGLFSAGFRLTEILAFVPTSITTIFLPRLAQAWHRDREAAVGVMRTYVRVVVTVALVPAILMIVETRMVISLVYGDAFQAAALAFRVLGVGIFFNFVAAAYVFGLIASDRDRVYIAAVAAGLAVSVVGGLIVVPRFGFAGAACIVTAIDLVTWLFTLRGVHASFGTTFVAAWARPALAGFALAACCLLGMAFGAAAVGTSVIACMVYGLVAIPWREVARAPGVGYKRTRGAVQ